MTVVSDYLSVNKGKIQPFPTDVEIEIWTSIRRRVARFLNNKKVDKFGLSHFSVPLDRVIDCLSKRYKKQKPLPEFVTNRKSMVDYLAKATYSRICKFAKRQAAGRFAVGPSELLKNLSNDHPLRKSNNPLTDQPALDDRGQVLDLDDPEIRFHLIAELEIVDQGLVKLDEWTASYSEQHSKRTGIAYQASTVFRKHYFDGEKQLKLSTDYQCSITTLNQHLLKGRFAICKVKEASHEEIIELGLSNFQIKNLEQEWHN